MGIELMVLTLAMCSLCLLVLGIPAAYSVVCAPNQVQVIKGRGDGSGREYRLLSHGWTFRIPLVETAQALDTTLLQVDVELDDLVCADRVMMDLHLDAFVSLSRFEPGVHAAIEGFLGSSRQEIIDAARRCLQGHITAVASELTSQQMQKERTRFIKVLCDEAEEELREQGFVVHSFYVQRIAGGIPNRADEREAVPSESTPR